MQQTGYEWMTAVRSWPVCSWRRFVPHSDHKSSGSRSNAHQRLMGASLLVFLNKTDVEHCMSEHEAREVSASFVLCEPVSLKLV
jgi:hypothetical protein